METTEKGNQQDVKITFKNGGNYENQKNYCKRL
jgi:hypothetical protein